VAHSTIVTVTLNPALDLTYTVDALLPQHTHRVAGVAERPGGKGINVARVLHSAGEPVLATGLLGGATGARIATLLRADGVPASFVPMAGETRRTVAVAAPAGATGFWEPGPTVAEAEWVSFLSHYAGLLDGAAVVVLSGSLPPGVPVDAYATLVRLAAAREVRTVLDTSGEPLRHGLVAGPDLVKPNADELAALLGTTTADDVADAARLRAYGAHAVVVSHGPRGLLALAGGQAWRGVPPDQLAGNATGAGDACVAALARGLRDESSWPDLVADAVALSAAAVASTVAGAVDPDTYRRMLPGVTVTAIRKDSDVYTDR
jgi:1-phosphofructokinase family hexose kinase